MNNSIIKWVSPSWVITKNKNCINCCYFYYSWPQMHFISSSSMYASRWVLVPPPHYSFAAREGSGRNGWKSSRRSIEHIGCDCGCTTAPLPYDAAAEDNHRCCRLPACPNDNEETGERVNVCRSVIAYPHREFRAWMPAENCHRIRFHSNGELAFSARPNHKSVWLYVPT